MKPIPPVMLKYIAGLKAHDVEKIGETAAENIQFVAATRTLDKPTFLAMLRALYTGFPDWHYDHDPPEWQGDIIGVKWRQGGTHTGTWAMPGMAPIPPTGKTVRIPEHYFHYRVEGDKLVWIRPDPIPGGAPRGILEQIGVPVPPL